MQVPKNIDYTKQHIWLQKIGRYDFCVGITNFGPKEIGAIDAIEHNSNEGTAYINMAPYNYGFAVLTAKIETVSLLNFQEYRRLK